MPRAVPAIALLTLRAAVRSRLVAALIVLLLATAAGLPLTLEGDGTAAGRVRILVVYTLGAGGFLLGVATLWAACGAVAQDIEARTLRLTAVKPVRAFEIWLGKWLGLVGLNALLLGAAGGMVYGMLQWHLLAGGLTAPDRRELDRDILVARREVRPLSVPDDPAVACGGRASWVFDVPRRGAADTVLQFRVRPFGPGGRAAWGRWEAGPPDGPARASHETEPFGQGVFRLALAPDVPAGGGVVRVTYVNGGEARSAPVLFDRDGGVMLLVRAGTFGGN
ncbi:MAG: ABC transporter permease, partial [Lentisphaerae bacterium]|nr:ABC transporter permease [Lentisphaerota bacterium]